MHIYDVQSWTLTTNFFFRKFLVLSAFNSVQMPSMTLERQFLIRNENLSKLLSFFTYKWISKGWLKIKVNNAQLFDGNRMSHNVVVFWWIGIVATLNECHDRRMRMNHEQLHAIVVLCVCEAYALFGFIFNLWCRKCIEIYVHFFLGNISSIRLMKMPKNPWTARKKFDNKLMMLVILIFFPFTGNLRSMSVQKARTKQPQSSNRLNFICE